jgi:omega-amidase
MVRIGAASLVISGDEKKARVCFDRLFDFCADWLPGCGCDIVLLPEQAESRPEEREALGGPITTRFGEIARQHRLYLIASVPEISRGKAYNTQAVFSPRGQCVYAYRKVHLAPGEEKIHAAGNAFNTFELPWFRAGLLTCFDNQFPESSRVLALKGARVIFFPSFGDLAKPHRNAARCLDNHIYLVGASIIDKSCRLPLSQFEQGMVMDPMGNRLCATGSREGLAIAELPLRAGRLAFKPVSKNCLKAEVNYLKRRRVQAYRPLLKL